MSQKSSSVLLGFPKLTTLFGKVCLYGMGWIAHTGKTTVAIDYVTPDFLTIYLSL